MASDVRDFGEYLVEVRDALEAELPVRVKPYRTFLAAAVEALCVPVLRALHLSFCSIVTTRPDPDDILRPMMREFEILKDKGATPIQFQQTQALFHEQMHRRVRHIDHEMARWNHAIFSGIYIGMLVYTLFLTSIFMSMVTDRVGWVGPIIVCFVVVQVLCTVTSRRGWLLCRP